MKKYFPILFLYLFFGCSNQKQHIQIQTPQPLEIFYPKQTLSLRQNLSNFRTTSLTSIAAVGDIMIGNHTTAYIKKYGVTYPFDSTKSILTSTQFTFGNLESPFTETGPRFDKRFTFKVPPKFATGLKESGFDIVTLANNHMIDYGIEGLEKTIITLDSLGVKHCGAGLTLEDAQKPAIVEKDGIKLAFLGYSMTFPKEFWATDSTGGTAFPTEKILKKAIQHCDSIADFTIITFHWGSELKNFPKNYQKHFARYCIDQSADLILGHHPHVLQGLEVYKNRLIAYSLGNFAFSSLSRKAIESIILKIYLTKNGLLYAKAIPIDVNNYNISFQPRILRGAKADTVLSHLQKFSEPLNTSSIINDLGYIWGVQLYQQERDSTLKNDSTKSIKNNLD